MNKLERFREWCKNNGPIFDFFSKIVFAIVTVTIAYYAVGIAKVQSEIQKVQLEVQRVQAQAQLEAHLPNIQIRYSLRKTDGPRIDDLTVSNEGAELFSLEVEVFPFWHPRELELIRQGEKREPNVQLKSALVPISNFFSLVSHASSEPRGQLRLFKGKPHVEWDLAVKEFEKSHSTARRSMAGDIKLFTHISYVDKFGQSHSRYFETQYWGMRPIPEIEGAAIASKYYQLVKSADAMDFDVPTQKELDRNWKLLHTAKEPLTDMPPRPNPTI